MRTKRLACLAADWATHPAYCTNVEITNFNIQGSRDGIDIDSCKNARVEGFS